MKNTTDEFNTADFVKNCYGLDEFEIEQLDFDQDNLTLKIYAKLPLKKSACVKCEGKFTEVHDWQKKQARMPPFGNYLDVTLYLKKPRGHCGNCLKVQTSKLFLHPQFPSMACGFAEYCCRLMEEMTCEAVARLTNTNSRTLWKLDQWRCEYLKKTLYELPKDLDVSKLSADEVHYRTKKYKSHERINPFSPRRNIKFLTTLICTSVSRVIACSPGRDARSLNRCFKELSPEQLLKVKYVSVDMNPGYFRSILDTCPDAEIAVDRLHLIQKLNETFDLVRKQEYAKATKRKDSFQKTMLSRGSRFIYLERVDTKSIEERNMLGKIKMLNDSISNAMILTDYFHTVLDQKGIKNFRLRLIRWYNLVRESKSKIYRSFAKKVRRYRKNIEAYIKTGLTTAISEGMNNKIKVLKRMGYGYSNQKAFQNKVLQRCGFLNSAHLKTNFLFWHVPTPQ